MVTKTQARRKQDIKSKLMAAIAMLLVSSIMMVSSTYAWFTLSTAPEVTGITTAVGANGNLEMALLPKSGNASEIGSDVGDSMANIGKDVDEANRTWGNLVDLSNDAVYGLDDITLYPSALNVATWKDNIENSNPATIAETILSTPTYGADGRVSELKQNTVTAIYDTENKAFNPGAANAALEYGVRAIGTASGMTERQLDYRNARSAANTATAQAKAFASQSLNTNGSALANIAIKYGMDKADATFNKADVEALRAMINGLKGDGDTLGGVFKQIETAYIQYILAFAASANQTDETYTGVKSIVTGENATLSSVLAKIGTTNIPGAVQNAIKAYMGENYDYAGGMYNSVKTADTNLKTLEEELETNANATFTWSDISAAMTPLANPASIKVNGFLASEVKDKLGELVSSVTAQGGLKVIMESGAGVYADIADQCGDFTASVSIAKVEYGGITLNNMAARMETKTNVNPVYLDGIATAIAAEGSPAGGAAGTMPITDMYGYIIDLAFRTNAAESNLLIQQDATDRIYGSDNTNEETMGHGSTMTFQATTADFTDDQLKDLMKAVRIVFFSKNENNKVYATAKLNADAAELTADGWEAKIVLYENVAKGTDVYTPAEYDANSGLTYYTKGSQDVYTEAQNAVGAAQGTLYTRTGEAEPYTYTQEDYTADSGKTYYTKSTAVAYNPVADPASATETLYVKTQSDGGETIKTDNIIMPLTQNQAHQLSVLVYLDGNNMGNEDVAATAATSMTGKMNLQFASSANLVPMEYADLHQSGTKTYDVTLPEAGVTGNDEVKEKTAYNFTLATGYTLNQVTVGNTQVTPTDNGNGSYTIPADKVTGDIIITVTAP